MRRDIKGSPFGAVITGILAVMLIFLTIDRFGLFAPGPVLQNLEMGGNIDASGDRFVFRVSGVKTTNDPLQSRAASWLYSDGTATAVAIEGNTPAQNRVAGDAFISQEYGVIIPAAARSDSGSVLRVCFIYDPGMSCVQKAFTDMEALP